MRLFAIAHLKEGVSDNVHLGNGMDYDLNLNFVLNRLLPF
jgi:hypothetical protein